MSNPASPSDNDIINISSYSTKQLEELDHDINAAVTQFYNNDINGAISVSKCKHPQLDSLYTLLQGTFSMLTALSTQAPDDIHTAKSILSESDRLASIQLDPAGGSGWIKDLTSLVTRKPASYNPAQLRSILVQAESCLLVSFLYLFQESLVGYMKSSLSLRKSQSNYSVVWDVYTKYLATGASMDSLIDKNTIEGIQFGIGSLNVVMSVMPKKVARLISLLGYKGDRVLGFGLLEKASQASGFRSTVAQLLYCKDGRLKKGNSVAGYNAILSSFAPSILGPSMIPIASRHIQSALGKYPDSSFHHLLLARVLRSTRQLPKSNTMLLRVSGWPELIMLSRYEYALNLIGLLQWEDAARVFQELTEKTYWSQALFTYAQACCYAMTNSNTKAMHLVAQCKPLVTRKYGGKVLAVEQWVFKRVDCILERCQGTNVVVSDMLPGLEILMIWNLFPSMDYESLRTVRDLVRECAQKDSVMHMVHASIEMELGAWDSARKSIETIQTVPDEQSDWVVPMSLYVLGVLEIQEHVSVATEVNEDPTIRSALQKALVCMQKAGKYSDYVFEVRLSFRIHLVSMQIEEWLGNSDLKLTRSLFQMPSI